MSDTPRTRYEVYRDSLEEKTRSRMEDGQEKYGDAWKEVSLDYLERRMEEEYYKFRRAVNHHNDDLLAMKCFSDMVNFGLMYMVRVDMEYGWDGSRREGWR